MPIFEIIVVLALLLLVIGVNQLVRATIKMNTNLKQISSLIERQGR